MRRPAILLILLILAPLEATANRGAQKTLVISGRTTDQEGFPIERVRVWVEGRDNSATSDQDGVYSLTVPLGSPVDLARRPLALSVRAQGRGWRFAIPGGDPALMLELAVAIAPDGTPRCVARSNEQRFAAAAARAVGLEGEAVGLLVIPFLGLPGEQGPTVRSPVLEHVAYASLGYSVPAPPVPAPTSVPTPSSVTAPSPAPSTTPGAGAGALPTGPAARPARRDSIPAAKVVKPPPSGSPPLASLTPVPGALGDAGRTDKGSSKGAPSPARATGDEVVSGGRSEPSPGRGVARRARNDTTIIRPEPSMRVTRARARPLLIRNPPPAVKEEPCECRIEGTLEVRWHRPLSKPERVEISLVGYPKLKDTVQLFMGSPRVFLLPEVPCGMHRLEIRVPSGRRYALLSRDGLGYFRCDRNRIVKRTVVLTPR